MENCLRTEVFSLGLEGHREGGPRAEPRSEEQLGEGGEGKEEGGGRRRREGRGGGRWGGRRRRREGRVGGRREEREEEGGEGRTWHGACL